MPMGGANPIADPWHDGPVLIPHDTLAYWRAGCGRIAVPADAVSYYVIS